MGSIVFRNRYWNYKFLYDDYLGREFKLSFRLLCFIDASLLVSNIQNRTGVVINRSIEKISSHKNFFVEYHSGRSRITHNLIYEEFEMIVEDWAKLERE